MFITRPGRCSSPLSISPDLFLSGGNVESDVFIPPAGSVLLPLS